MREKILFDEGWIFHEGDVDKSIPIDKGPMYKQAKTETMLWGPAAINYIGCPDNYSNAREVSRDAWERVTLPHDYIIRQTPSKQENNTLGFFKYENAWYRKEFYLDEADAERRLRLVGGLVGNDRTLHTPARLCGKQAGQARQGCRHAAQRLRRKKPCCSTGIPAASPARRRRSGWTKTS